jgi:hypothetical protein
VTPGPTYEQAAYSALIASNYRAADQLLTTAGLDQSRPVVAANLVRIDQPSRSSSLGRLISEQIAARLAQYGVPVVATRLPAEIYPQKEGALLLPSEVRAAMDSYDTQALLVGTYAPAENFVYVNVKLVRSSDSLVLSAYDYVLPLDGNIASLLPR